MKEGGEMVEIQSPIPSLKVAKPMAQACDDHDVLVEELIKYQCPRG